MANGLEKQHQMLREVDAVLRQHADTWGASTGFSEIVADFRHKLTSINNSLLGLTDVNADPEERKFAMEELLISRLLLVAGALKVLGRRSGQDALASGAATSRQELHRLNERELLRTAERLRDLALENQEGLEKYNVDKDVLTGLQDDVMNYSLALRNNPLLMAEQEPEGGNLRDILRAAALLLDEELDMAMEVYADQEPAFYRAYQQARLLDVGEIKR